MLVLFEYNILCHVWSKLHEIPCHLRYFFVGFWLLPRNHLVAHSLPPSDVLFLPSFLGSFLNYLVVKLNRQAMHDEGSPFYCIF